MPGPESHEKDDGAQPFLQTLLQAIGECWNPSAALSSSPAKIPKTEKKRKRFIDFLLQKEGRWDAVIFDDTLTVPVEVKPGCRKNNGGPLTLLNEARDQVLSHLAKHLFIGFNFTTFGVPCHATGIIANMAAVQILHLRYENVGTPEAKLELYQSKLALLMSWKNFKRWTASMSRGKGKKELEPLEQALFGNDTKFGVDDEIPKGIQILLNLMNQPSKKLHGISVETSSNILGDQLGTGATAVVFRAGADSENANSVVKLSRYGIKTDIDNELNILRTLATNNGKGTSKNKHIPSIIHSEAIQDCMLTVELGSVLTKLPAIETAPAGKNVASLILRPAGNIGTTAHYLRLVLNGIQSALEHMHASGICHCDVAPKNIVIASDTAETTWQQERAVLIDYSISSLTSQTFHGFRGYVHRGIFWSTLSQKAWKPQPEHDKAGLGFTLAFLSMVACAHGTSVILREMIRWTRLVLIS